MKRELLVLVLASGCGGVQPAAEIFPGKWVFTVELNVALADGGVGKAPRSTTATLNGSADGGVAWAFGGCALPLAVSGDDAVLPAKAECTLAVTDDLPLIPEISSPKKGDVAVVSSAKFTVVRGPKAKQVDYTFASGEPGLGIDFELRLRPASEPVDSTSGDTFTFKSTTVYAHKVK